MNIDMNCLTKLLFLHLGITRLALLISSASVVCAFNAAIRYRILILCSFEKTWYHTEFPGMTKHIWVLSKEMIEGKYANNSPLCALNITSLYLFMSEPAVWGAFLFENSSKTFAIRYLT